MLLKLKSRGSEVLIAEGGTIVATVNETGWGEQAPAIAEEIAAAMNEYREHHDAAPVTEDWLREIGGHYEMIPRCGRGIRLAQSIRMFALTGEPT